MAPLPVLPNEAEVAEAVLAFATSSLTCGRVPRFASPEWVMLPDDDPAKKAAVVRAALAWWGRQLLEGEEHVEVSSAVSGGYDWSKQANRPTRAEVERRRSVPVSGTRGL